MMGPAVIAFGGSIGGGEWLMGPALFVKYGLVLLWITTVSTTLQTFFNLEMTRYTLVTGEPITIGFMRLKPASILGLALHHCRVHRTRHAWLGTCLRHGSGRNAIGQDPGPRG